MTQESQTPKDCRDLLAAGKSLYTFDHPANADLLKAGARPITSKTDTIDAFVLRPPGS